jgi:predicted TIM-barrel fold metal-dependent hydrolase
MAKVPPVSYPPDPNPRKPKLKVPPGAWDTHFHIMGPPQLFPYSENRSNTPPAAPVEHWLAMAEALGIERGCTVQSSVYDNNPAVTLDAIKKSEGRLVGMLRADPTLDDATIKKLHAGGIRGIRIELREAGSSDVVKVDPRKLHGHVEGAAFDKLVALVAKHRWVVSLHISPKALSENAERIRKMPTQTVIENYGSADARLGPDQPGVKVMVDLAQEKHVWLKLASAYRMVERGGTWEQIKPIAVKMHAASPDRTIWGTDWPHPGIFKPGKMPNDGDLLDTLIDYCPDETNRRKLLVDNPKRLFDFT